MSGASKSCSPCLTENMRSRFRMEYDCSPAECITPGSRRLQTIRSETYEQAKAYSTSPNQLPGELILAAHISQPLIAPLIKIGQLLVIESQQPKDRRVQVVRIHAHFGCLHAELIGRAQGSAALHAAARHPRREPVRMMVAA